MNVNPYAPLSVSIDSHSRSDRWTLKAVEGILFVLAFVVGVHLYSLQMNGLHNTFVTFDAWNLLVRLPYLGAIQLILLVLYSRLRTIRPLHFTGQRWVTPLVLGLLSGIVRFYAYVYIRVIPEDVFGVQITWTPHYMIIWVACAFTTIAVVESWLVIRWLMTNSST